MVSVSTWAPIWFEAISNSCRLYFEEDVQVWYHISITFTMIKTHSPPQVKLPNKADVKLSILLTCPYLLKTYCNKPLIALSSR